MPSVTIWNRLEPASRPADVSAGLEARLYDPLWLLGRQWQMREFAGQDAGSPVTVTLAVDAYELTRYFGGGVAPDGVMAGTALNNRAVPLEALAEREPRARLRWRLAADAGAHFERCLDRHQVVEHAAAFRAQYALTSGPAPGRMIDGGLLAVALRPALHPDAGAPGLPARPPIPLEDQADVVAAGLEWLQWFDALVARPEAGESAWRTDRLEYEFCAATATPEREIVMTAQNYPGGNLDWYDFTIRYGATLGGSPAEARAHAISQTLIPAPVTFPGMPASRWWEFENATVDVSAVSAGPEDPIRLLLAEFALIYGNDWFLVPVELPVGTLSRVRALTVTNSFGETVAIQPFTRAGGAGANWRVFAVTEEGRIPSPAPAGGDLFFLPPVLGPSLDGQADEEVAFVRDEMANFVWAIEKTIGGAIQSTSPAPAAPSATEGDRYRYQISTGVREHWIPFVPVQGPRSSLLLRRGRILDAQGRPAGAQATVLQSDGPMLIHDEEVPREGLTLRRAFQFARWTDGSSHLWTTRQTQPIAREGSSGLGFDLAVPTDEGT
jgi:hypothetical protein